MKSWKYVTLYITLYVLGGPLTTLVVHTVPLDSVLPGFMALLAIFTPAALIGASVHLLFMRNGERIELVRQLKGGTAGGVAFAAAVIFTFILNPSLALLITDGWRVVLGALATGFVASGTTMMPMPAPIPEKQRRGAATA